MLHHSDIILVRVNGRKARLERSVTLHTGGFGDVKVQFMVEPGDAVWAAREPVACFEAVTNVGARIKCTANVALDWTAAIPEKVLRERTKFLYVALKGTNAAGEDAVTNVVNLGPVQAAGFGLGAPMSADPREGDAFLERAWRLLMAKLAEVSPAVRTLLATVQRLEARVAAMEEGQGETDG